MTKPSRTPDYISKTGAYFWFDDLILMRLDGSLWDMLVEENSSLLRIKEPHSMCGDCWRCTENKDCERAYFKKEIQHAYKQWAERSFEKAFQLEGPDDAKG